MKFVGIGITAALFVIGLYYSIALAVSTDGWMFGYAPATRWNIEWVSRYALLVSASWCLCAAALRALCSRRNSAVNSCGRFDCFDCFDSFDLF